MAAPGFYAVNKAYEVTDFEVSEFMHCKITKMESFADVTSKMYFRWLRSTNKCMLHVNKKCFTSLSQL